MDALINWVYASSGDPLVDFLRAAGPVGILAWAVVSFMRGWIVPGSAFDRAIEERDRALQVQQDAITITRKALDAGIELRKRAVEDVPS